MKIKSSTNFYQQKNHKGTQRNTNSTNTLKTRTKKIKKFGVKTPVFISKKITKEHNKNMKKSNKRKPMSH